MSGLLAVKISLLIPDLNESGLFAIFLDSETNSVEGAYSAIINSETFDKFDLKQPVLAVANEIMDSKNKYTVVPEVNQRVSDRLSGSFVESDIADIFSKLKSKDTGAVEFILKRVIFNASAVQDFQIKFVCDTVSYGDFQKIYVQERLQRLTPAEKSKIAMKYCRDNSSVADSVIKNNEKNVATLMFKVVTDKVPSFAGILYYSISAKCYIGRTIALASRETISSLELNQGYIDFHDELEEMNASSAPDEASLKKIDESLKGVDSAEFERIVSSKDVSAGKRFVEKLFMYYSLKIEVSVKYDFANCIEVELIAAPGKCTGEEAKHTEESGSPLGRGVTVVDVDLVLSPTKGKKVSQLQSGDTVQVLIDSSSPSGMKIIRTLKLFENNRVKPIGAVVNSIKKSEKGEFKIYVKIAEELYGKSIEEVDIKVKTVDPVVEEFQKSSNISLVIGIAVGVVVILIIALILWIV